LRELWQVPALGLAGVLLVGGVAMAFLTKPKPNYDGLFTRSAALVSEEKFGEAIDALTKDVGPYAQKGQLDSKQLQRYHLMLGRSLSMGQRGLGIDREENNRAIEEQFTQAEKKGATLEAYDIKLLADALVSLGKTGEAITRADTIRESKPELRIEVYQRVIELAIAGEGKSPSHSGHGEGSSHGSSHGAGAHEESSHAAPAEQEKLGFGTALELMGRLTADADLPKPVKVWIVLRQAEILLEESHPEQAERRLQQAMLRLDELEPRELAELLILLSRAYADAGDFAGAERQLETASRQLDPNDAMMGDILLAGARVNDAQGQAAKALEGYRQVVTRFPSSSGILSAMFGLARVQAEEGNDDEASKSYDALLERLKTEGPTRLVNAETLTEALLSHFKDRFDAGEVEQAHRYAAFAESLSGEDGPQAAVLIALARVNQALGEASLATAAGNPGEQTALTLASADPATAAVARAHFSRAGNEYRQHAQRVVIDDTASYGESLWAAARMFDRAGDLDEAIKALKLFVAGFPGDSRLSEAKFKLAEAYFASGDLDSAQRLYRELIENRQGVDGTGPYADLSVVPLARTLISDSDPKNDDEGERWLVRAVSGDFGGPGTDNYRLGLDELARYYYRTGRQVEAIARLGEYVDRYGTDEDDAPTRMARFRLADARRQFAAEAKAHLDKDKMPDAERQRLVVAREAALRASLGEFERVRREFEDVKRRTPLEDTCLRNSYFYLGECAFELGEYDDAIRHYAAAKERYPRDPASLVAMVQIVGAYQALGEPEKARTANARARAFFESLPDEVWNDPTLPMGRDAWQRWLDATLQLERVTSGNQSEGG
jgi:tetratricopeptide (TPR) repeat protein